MNITINTFKDWKLSMTKWELSNVNSSAFSDIIEVDDETLDWIMTCHISEVQDKLYNLLYWKFRSPNL